MNILEQHKLLTALLLVGLSMVWISLLPWAVLGLVFLFLPRLLSYGRWHNRTPVDGLVLFLVVQALLSLWITPLPEITAPQVWRLLTGIALFYVLINWLTRIERLAWLTVGAASLAPALAFVSIFTVEWPAGKLPLIPTSIYTHFARFFQDAIHPNVLAGNLAVVLPLLLALLLYRWGNHAIKPRVEILLRLMLTGLLVYSMLILLLTQSRSSWLAFGMAASFLIILRFRWGWLLVLFGGIGTLCGIYYFLDYEWLLRWLRSSYLIGDLASRIDLWARGLFIIQDFFFTGIGMGTFAQTTNTFYPLRGAAPPHVHNLFLQVGVDLGMPGLLAWLAILMVVTWCAWSLYRQSELEGTWLNVLGVGLLGSQLALVLHGLFDSVTWGMVRPAPLIWGLWGLCLGAYLLVNRQYTRDA